MSSRSIPDGTAASAAGSTAPPAFEPARIDWRGPDGAPVACVEKLKVLAENLRELRDMAQDALEDAVLMGCDETQFRAVLTALAASLTNPYAKE